MKETTITRSILRYLKTVPECFAWKIHGNAFQLPGLPDISVTYRGRSVYLEVKVPGGKVSRIQEVTHDRLREAGADVWVVTSTDDVKQIIRSLSYATGTE